ncbi:sulfoxide reductase heme-binding subunit YedZ [Roseococcus sp. SYP-B2431]|uniref:sulfite oxidase heme-binding subunit YedZ n=1 Tax=Roseococcus sp. SYP-B2431 TaxID=2496640 RepID=UPI00103F902E|nr:ferric reductase-like transmembrane domain-containing protein [Roseococcus sp. SYP-B2431]TCI00371.1 sulfoxide reductase heme-binding subunit YedZ [Roseococcus sp. SYP-B2431]
MNPAGRAQARPVPDWALWRERSGKLSPLRIVALAILILPSFFILADWWQANLGPEPLNAAMHETGRWSIRFLIASLAITPAGRILAWPRLYQIRRMLGLGALAWVLLHLVLYLADQNWIVTTAIAEIAKRFYLTIGFVALLGLCLLGWTSTDGWMRRLGRRWKKLHRLIFPIVLVAMLHAFIQAKSDVSQESLLTGILLWLLLWRLIPARLQSNLLALAALTVLAFLATVATEYAWFALATNLPAGRVAAANFDLTFGPRPAAWASIGMAGFVALAAGRQLVQRRRRA